MHTQSTMDLLQKAIDIAPIPTWTKKLHLTRDAIAGTKGKGYLTPVIAAALAVELEEDVGHWTTLAVLESAKDSPAKRALLKKLKGMRGKITSLYFALGRWIQRPLFSTR